MRKKKDKARQPWTSTKVAIIIRQALKRWRGPDVEAGELRLLLQSDFSFIWNLLKEYCRS